MLLRKFSSHADAEKMNRVCTGHSRTLLLSGEKTKTDYSSILSSFYSHKAPDCTVILIGLSY